MKLYNPMAMSVVYIIYTYDKHDSPHIKSSVNYRRWKIQSKNIDKANSEVTASTSYIYKMDKLTNNKLWQASLYGGETSCCFNQTIKMI